VIKSALLRDQGILIVTPDEALDKADFERPAEEIDPFIAANGKLTGLMVCVNTFPGWDSFAAFLSHLNFVRDHHRNIKRVAAVTDSQLLNVMTHLARHFVSAEVRQFPSDQKLEALTWLEAGP